MDFEASYRVASLLFSFVVALQRTRVGHTRTQTQSKPRRWPPLFSSCRPPYHTTVGVSYPCFFGADVEETGTRRHIVLALGLFCPVSVDQPSWPRPGSYP